MILYVKWIFAGLLTVPMILFGWYLLRRFNEQTRGLRTERAMRVPSRQSKARSQGPDASGRNSGTPGSRPDDRRGKPTSAGRSSAHRSSVNRSSVRRKKR